MPLKHGYDASKGVINIHVRVEKNDDFIDVEIADNGVGMSTECIERYIQVGCVKKVLDLLMFIRDYVFYMVRV